jgi:hypothetical protein
MQRLLLVSMLLISSLIFLPATHARTHEGELIFADASALHVNATRADINIKTEEEEFLEATFAPDTIPLAGIPVLENALGDVVQDSVINILDLLRLRDIVLGRPPVANVYEISKGDINHDGKIDSVDISHLRDILLHKRGVPYSIDSSGGIVQGQDVSLKIPPGALESPEIVTVTGTNIGELVTKFNIDPSAETQDDNYLMGSFEIETQNGSYFNKPISVTTRLDTLPPCRFSGMNVLLEILDDLDGNGRGEIVMRNMMHPSQDSSFIISDSISIPVITGLAKNNNPLNFNPRNTALEPGQTLEISGTHFPRKLSSLVVIFTSPSGKSSTWIPNSFAPNPINSFSQITGVRVFVPYLNDPGLTRVKIRNLENGTESSEIEFEALPLGSPPTNPEDTVQKFFTLVDSTLGEIVTCNSIMNAYQPLSSMLYSQISKYRLIVDSLFLQIRSAIDTSSRKLEFYGLMARLIINSGALDSSEALIASMNYFCEGVSNNVTDGVLSGHPVSNSCDDLKRIGGDIGIMGGAVGGIGAIVAVAAGTVVVVAASEAIIVCGAVLAVTGGIVWAVGEFGSDASDRIEFVTGKFDQSCNLPPPGEPSPPLPSPPGGGSFSGPGGSDGGNSPTGGIDPDGHRHTNGCCVNIFKYRQNLQGSVGLTSAGSAMSQVPQNTLKKISTISSNLGNEKYPSNSVIVPVSFWESSLKGAIIAPVNVRAAYGVVGIIGRAGNWLIPSLPMNTDVTLSIYDPKTGLYDPNVATIHTNNVPGQFGEVLATFNPDTTTHRFLLQPGVLRSDSVSLLGQRVEYNMSISANDTSKLFNLGFHASVPLSFKVEDPQGNLIVDNTNTSCYIGKRLQFNQIGTYKIRVAFGTSTLPGSFTVGVNYYPNPPLGHLVFCDEQINDTLYQKFSPYVIGGAVSIQSADTVVSESGVTLEFQRNSSVTANGMLKGKATPQQPIVLKPATLPLRQSTDIRAIKGVEVIRKEGGK